MAAVHHHDAVGQLQRLFLVVGDEHGGVAGLAVQLAQPAAQVLAHLGVERAERLVEQQHARLDRQGAGQGHALALAAGQLVGEALVEAAELHQLQQLQAAAADLGGSRAFLARAHAQAESDVVQHRHVLEQGVVLEHEADAALLHAELGGVGVAEQDLAAVERLQAGDRAQQGGLARAGRAEQGEQLARGDVQVEAVKSPKRLTALRMVMFI